MINQMLQDLDARRAAHGVGTRLPNDVRPLPKASASYWPLGVALGVGLIVVLGAGFVMSRGEAVRYLQKAFSSGPVAAPPSAALPETAAAPPVLALPAESVAVSPVADTALPAAASETASAASTLGEGVDVSLRMADFVDASAEPSSATAATQAPAESSVALVAVEKPAVRDTKPAATAGKAAAAEPSPAAPDKAADRSRQKLTAKLEGKSGDTLDPRGAATVDAKPVIERTPVLGSPHERAENEYRKALAAVNQGRVPEAMDDLREALRQEALHSAARQLLIKLLLEAKNQDEAIRVLQDGLAGQPAQLGWAMSLARLQVDRGELDGAWRTLEHSLPAAGGSPDYLGFAANVLQRLGRYDEAAGQYRKATRLSPADGRWWLGLGWCLDAQGNAAEAREALLRARQAGNLSPELISLIDQKLR
ncbi:MAG: tetratricopeptide repeat protein [Propionivibrio sp.]